MFIAKKRLSMKYFSDPQISFLITALDLSHNQKCNHTIILEHSEILNFLECSCQMGMHTGLGTEAGWQR